MPADGGLGHPLEIDIRDDLVVDQQGDLLAIPGLDVAIGLDRRGDFIDRAFDGDVGRLLRIPGAEAQGDYAQ